MRRRDTAGLTAAAALALSFAPTLMRRRRREQLAISVASAALGGLAGAASEVLVLRLARAIEARRGEHGTTASTSRAPCSPAPARSRCSPSCPPTRTRASRSPARRRA